MRIGVDATCWQNRRGYGRHARALLGALIRLDTENRYVLFLDSAEDADGLPPGAEVRLLRNDVPTAVAASADGHRSASDLWRMGRAMSTEPLDTLLFPTIYSYVPTVTRARKLVVIHDVIAETYPRLTVPRTASRLFWKAKVALGRMQADALITVSEFSRRGMIKRFGVSPERVFVVGEAADPVFRVLSAPRTTTRLESFGVDLKRPIVVYIGGFGPHKNLEELVAAFARCSKDALLIMVGDYKRDVFHSYFETVKAAVTRLGLDDRVIFTGFLPDEELVVLLNLSAVLVLPSLMEGFGLPAIEAAACGCPVVATRNSPLPELLGEGGIYISPGQGELEGALDAVLNSRSLRLRMRETAIEAAGRLTWDAAARQMMRVIQTAVVQ